MVPRRRYTPRERTRVAYEQGYKCASCTLLLPPDWQLDHVLPLCAGGGNERWMGLGRYPARAHRHFI